MSLDWDLIWKIFQVVALLIIAREIDKKYGKEKNRYLRVSYNHLINLQYYSKIFTLNIS